MAETIAEIIWVHEEALRADHPLFQGAAADARAVFVWDNAYFDAMDIGFKRRVFIYEALTELPVDIIAGDTVAVLTELAAGKGIRVAETPNAHLRSLIQALQQTHRVEKIADDAFVHLSTSPDLKRFFRYWNKAKKSAMQPHGGTRDLFGG